MSATTESVTQNRWEFQEQSLRRHIEDLERHCNQLDALKRLILSEISVASEKLDELQAHQQ